MKFRFRIAMTVDVRADTEADARRVVERNVPFVSVSGARVNEDDTVSGYSIESDARATIVRRLPCRRKAVSP